MENEKQGLDILIIEDQTFDSGLCPSAMDVNDDEGVWANANYAERARKYIESVSTKTADYLNEIGYSEWAKKYESFSQRLSDSLKSKGHQINKIDIKTRFDEKDRSLLSEYDVIISDMIFPTDYKQNYEQIKQLQTKNKGELKKLRDFLFISDFDIDAGLLELFIGEKGSGNSKHYGGKFFCNGKTYEDIEEYMKKHSVTDYAFMATGFPAKEQDKKISFYTGSIYNHGIFSTAAGVLFGILDVNDVIDVVNKGMNAEESLEAQKKKNQETSKTQEELHKKNELLYESLYNSLVGKINVSSDSGKFIHGNKGSFDSWVNAAEAAIKYQTKEE